MTNKEKIVEILERVKKLDGNVGETGYSSDNKAIERLFSLTDGNKQADILLRLTVVDSMYSTQMNRRYYGLDELSERLSSLNVSKDFLKNIFIQLTKDYDLTNFQLKGEKTNLFSEKYGIGKDGNDKGMAISLISKYAYLVTGYKFPIFDSIVCEMYPIIWKYCGWVKKEMPALKDKSNDGGQTMVLYLKAINELIRRLGGGISYQHLDRMLWFVGKIMRGNLSLVLSREDFEWCTKHLSTCRDENGKFKFDINNIELSDLVFLQKGSLVYDFFELAKELSKK